MPTLRSPRTAGADPEPGCDVKLLCADWLEAVSGFAASGERFDLVYADPPFMTGRVHAQRGGAFDDRWTDSAAYLRWLGERLAATIPLIRPTGSVLLHVDWRTSHRVRVLLDEMLGERCFVNHIVWSYGLGGSSPRRFARKHDDILFYAVDPERYWFEAPRIPATSARMRGQTKKATDVLQIPSINNMALERCGWPTQKPLALLEVLIGACCPPGGSVLDPCCGSGTAVVAARRLGRRAIGVDIDPRAIALAGERLARGVGRDGR